MNALTTLRKILHAALACVLLLALTAAFGILGWGGGLVLIAVLLVTNKTVNGEYSYLYPIIPFNGRALVRQIFRVKKNDFNRR